MNATFLELPQFEVVQIQRTETAVKCSGVIKNLARHSRAKPGNLVTICLNENKFIKGRFSEINSDNFQASIEVTDLESQGCFVVGEKYPLLNRYWGDLAELVLNPSMIWKKVKFEPQDSTVYYPDGRVEIRKDGWDHEHCRICSQNISVFEADNQFGYINQNDDWLCESCYQNYVLKKSLDFIIINQMF